MIVFASHSDSGKAPESLSAPHFLWHFRFRLLPSSRVVTRHQCQICRPYSWHMSVHLLWSEVIYSLFFKTSFPWLVFCSLHVPFANGSPVFRCDSLGFTFNPALCVVCLGGLLEGVQGLTRLPPPPVSSAQLSESEKPLEPRVTRDFTRWHHDSRHAPAVSACTVALQRHDSIIDSLFRMSSVSLAVFPGQFSSKNDRKCKKYIFIVFDPCLSPNMIRKAHFPFGTWPEEPSHFRNRPCITAGGRAMWSITRRSTCRLLTWLNGELLNWVLPRFWTFERSRARCCRAATRMAFSIVATSWVASK